MKKSWKRHSQVFRQRVLQNKADKRRRRAYKNKRRQGLSLVAVEAIRLMQLRRNFPDYEFITAPKVFSLLTNEVATLRFLRDINKCYQNQEKVLIRLDGVKTISNDALVLLCASMIQFQTSDIKFNGTKPTNKIVRQKVEKSGFYYYLLGKEIEKSEAYSFNSMESRLYTHGQKRVDSKLANDIVKHASTFVWGEPRRCQGVQKTLLELMHNTFDHADSNKGEKHWWLSVEQNKKQHEVTFAFIDFGIGIFRSLRNKKVSEPLYGALDRLMAKFPWVKTEPEMLKLILEGHIRKTQTKKYNRGKGLSKIHTLYKENKISSLVMISNYASTHVWQDDFHELEDEFLGTFISFKINKNTVSLPWIG